MYCRYILNHTSTWEQQPPHNAGCGAFTPVGLGGSRRTGRESEKKKKGKREKRRLHVKRDTEIKLGEAIMWCKDIQ